MKKLKCIQSRELFLEIMYKMYNQNESFVLRKLAMAVELLNVLKLLLHNVTILNTAFY